MTATLPRKWQLTAEDWAQYDRAIKEALHGSERELPVPQVPFHPAADTFPLLGPIAIREMAETIKEIGLKEPIVVYDGKILDGRNRYLACLEAGVEPTYVVWDEIGDPYSYVLARNKVRRHQTVGELAMAAAKCAKGTINWNKAHRKMSRQEKAIEAEGGTANGSSDSYGEAAKKAGLGRSTVQRAAKVLETGTPELQQAVAEETVSVTAAAEIASLPPEEQVQAIEQSKVGLKPPPDKLDPAGQVIPEQAMEAFACVPEMNQMCRALDTLATRIEVLGNGPAGTFLHAREIIRDIENARRAIHDRRPAYACCYCKGNDNIQCAACSGSGWLTKSIYDQAPLSKKPKVDQQ